MRGAAVLLLACLASVAGDVVQVYAEEKSVPLEQLQQQSESQPQTETVFLVDQETDGGLRVTGMMQNFRIDSTGFNPFNTLLTRPQTSFLDLTWSSWIEQRMEKLDMLQNLLAPVPRCPHMRPDSSSLDTSMVSYLASSRFGPAILTTYAQKFHDEEEDDDDADFDVDEVYIPEGMPLGLSYEDASLLEDMSIEADKALEKDLGLGNTQVDPRLLSQQQQGLGFFAANIKTPQDKAMFPAQLDGDSESLQPTIRQEPPLKPYVDRLSLAEGSRNGVITGERESMMDAHKITGLALFIVLCSGCIYVWISLLYSCMRLGKEMRAKQQTARTAEAHKLAQAELLAPLMPEGAAKVFNDIETAACYTPHGTYFAPQGSQYVKVAVPLVNCQVK